MIAREGLSAMSDKEKVGQALAVLETAVTVLREQLGSANRRADTADADRRAAEGRAEEAVTRADALQGLLEATQLELAEQRALTDRADAARQRAQGTIEALREVDEARKASGRWARLWTAWRGE
jgi:hypothetical protein